MTGRASPEPRFYEELPWVFGLAWLAGMLSVFPWIASLIPSSIPLELRLIWSQLIPAVAVAALLTMTHTWRRSLGAIRPRRGSLWIAALAFLPLLVTAVVRTHQGAALLWSASVVIALVIGLYEEVFYRGFLLEAFARSADRGVLWSSAFFGLAHARNLVVASPVGVVSQIIFATGMGILGAAIRRRTGVLWPLVAAHATLDLIVLVGLAEGPALAGASDLPIWIGAAVLFAAIGLLLGPFERELVETQPRTRVG